MNFDRESKWDYEFSEDSIVVRQGLGEGDENDDVGGVKRLRERALKQVVEDESSTGLDAVFEEHNAATEVLKP